MAQKILYRWVEPESRQMIDGNEFTFPAHQEEGEYLEEATLRGYVIVLWNGNKHLVADRDIVAIVS